MVNGFNGNGTPSFAGLYSGDLPSLDLLMGIICYGHGGFYTRLFLMINIRSTT